MANVSIDIEQVVREVMAELGLAQPRRSPARENAAADQTSPRPFAGEGPGVRAAGQPVAPASNQLSALPPTSSPQPSHELTVSARVVTLAELDGRLGNGVRRVLVAPRAIVTPSVRDELRRKNIDLVVAGSDSKSALPSAGIPLAVVVHGKTDPEPLLKALAGDGIPVQPHQSDCIIAAGDLLAQRLAGGNALGLLLTKYAAAAVCLANRLPGVRAVLATDPATVAADAASVGANLLVVNPVHSGLFRARQIIGQFYRQGPQECPAAFRERLK
ncbi:MAG: hypothetical protein HUU20_13450 [Pirellulales bacterium]|nr:hypothetical protein [Pirellulales bacterium]